MSGGEGWAEPAAGPGPGPGSRGWAARPHEGPLCLPPVPHGPPGRRGAGWAWPGPGGAGTGRFVWSLPLQRERGAGGDRLGRPEVPAAARLAGGPDAEAGRPEQEAGAPGERSGPLLAFPQALQELRAGQLPPAPRQPPGRGRRREPVPRGPCCCPAQPGGHGVK